MASDFKQHLNEMQNLPLNIAVTGEAGVGKSSFVNAIRSVMDDDEEAAEVGIREQTTQPKAYPHPSIPNIQIWDLPGIGTPRFKAAEYVQKVQFERYGAFIMVTSHHFTANDDFLIKEIQRTRKKFYCVYTKIDAKTHSEKMKMNFNMEKTLAIIRKRCEDHLRRASGLYTRVFLISSWKTDKYDFPLLRETMAAELPYYKKHISTKAAQLFSEGELRMKKDEIISYIKKVALLSCACGVMPVPGLSMLCDIPILLDALKCICNAFGLDEHSLYVLAIHTGKELEELKSAIKKTPLANTINLELLFFRLKNSSLWVNVSIVEVALNFMPLIGSVFGGMSSFAVTYHFLNTFLDGVMEDARNLQTMFLE
ncbi:PREDICTED: interferon-inducible GTPase 5-like [Thamnophis sirtalis]|uniref:Interferon-inducible GTPase 5-like n=1 Tax=Thamnophis sirtalis TaxID=35019 RepID=A0A6I9Z551_9SAUR|nr:PREDICTED: interferon-inducible GTPase 5-like [Thamnophis sirtalis]